MMLVTDIEEKDATVSRHRHGEKEERGRLLKMSR